MQYLLGREFILRTDHSSLVWLRNFVWSRKANYSSLVRKTPGVEFRDCTDKARNTVKQKHCRAVNMGETAMVIY